MAGFSRAILVAHEVFGPLFAAEKSVVAAMIVLCVVVADALKWALLAVYAALELGMPFNSLETS